MFDGVPLVRANRGAGKTSMAAILLTRGGTRTGDNGVLEPHLSGHRCQERG